MINLVKNSVLIALVLLGQVCFGSEGPFSEKMAEAYPSLFGTAPADRPDIVDIYDFSSDNMVSLGSGSTPAPVAPVSFSSIKEKFSSLGLLKKTSYNSDSAKKAACVVAGAAAIYVGYKVVKSYCKQSCEINKLGDFLKKHEISTIHKAQDQDFDKNDFYWFKWLRQYKSPTVLSKKNLFSLIKAAITSKQAYLFSNYYSKTIQTNVNKENILKAIEAEQKILYSNLEKLAPMVSNGYDKTSWFSVPKSLLFSKTTQAINESLIRDILSKWSIGFTEEKTNSSWFGPWNLFRSPGVQKTAAIGAASSASQSSQNKKFKESLSGLSEEDITNLKGYFVNKYGSYLNNAAAVYFDTLIAWAYLQAMQNSIEVFSPATQARPLLTTNDQLRKMADELDI